MMPLEHLPENTDRFTVAELEDRYGIKHGSLYERFKAAGIVRNGSGRPAYCARAVVQLLDQLHCYIKDGGLMAAFPDKIKTAAPAAHSPSLMEAEALIAFLEALFSPENKAHLETKLAETLAAFIPSPLTPAQLGMELAHLRELQEAYQHGWHLTSAEIGSLLSLSPQTINGYGEQWDDAGFTFTRTGNRCGDHTAWQLGKTQAFSPLVKQVLMS